MQRWTGLPAGEGPGARALSGTGELAPAAQEGAQGLGRRFTTTPGLLAAQACLWGPGKDYGRQVDPNSTFWAPQIVWQLVFQLCPSRDMSLHVQLAPSSQLCP